MAHGGVGMPLTQIFVNTVMQGYIMKQIFLKTDPTVTLVLSMNLSTYIYIWSWVWNEYKHFAVDLFVAGSYWIRFSVGNNRFE